MAKYCCIDVGGTSIKYGVYLEEKKEFVYTKEMPTEAMKYGGSGIMEKMKTIVREARNNMEINGICISTAGMVDCEKGEITYAAPLIPNYTGTKIKKQLEEEFKVPCEVENDVNCAALAEYFEGAGKDSHSCLCLTIGTGIGGAFVSKGQVFHGFSGSGCEVGYMNLGKGQFQDLASTKILVEKVAQKKGLDQETLDGKIIFEQAKSGDAICNEAIDQMCDVLGMGIANLCYVLNPQVVVLGGGIMAQKEFLKPKIQASLKQYLLPSVEKHTQLAFAQNGNHAGMLGAYYHFSHYIQKHS